MKATIILVFILCASLAPAATPPEGTFEWVSTEESPGEFTTPDDLGYTVQREFMADLAYHEYRDEVLYRSGEFWVADVEFMGVIITALYIECAGFGVEVCAFGYLADGLEFFWGADEGGWPSFPRETLSSREPVSNTTVSWGNVKSLFR